jgi:hypothetical protein
MTEPKRSRGRPRKYAENRVTTGFRASDELRTKIREAAIANGRSQSEEIEARVAASFDQPALIDALAERWAARMKEASIRNAAWMGRTVPPLASDYERILDRTTIAAVDHLHKGMKSILDKDEFIT